MSKCQFGVKQVDFLGRTITPHGVAPQADKVKSFLSNLQFFKSKKALQRYIAFLNYYQNYIRTLFRTACSVFQTPQRNFQILRTNKPGRRFHEPQQTS